MSILPICDCHRSVSGFCTHDQNCGKYDLLCALNKQEPPPIGQILKAHREASGKTLRQVEVATNISNAYLSQLENGKIKNPSFRVLKKLCDYYNVPITNFSGGDTAPNIYGWHDEFGVYVTHLTDDEKKQLLNFAKFLIHKRA